MLAAYWNTGTEVDMTFGTNLQRIYRCLAGPASYAGVTAILTLAASTIR